jgi:RNA ligase
MLPDEQTKADCLYMRYFGGKSYFDSQKGILWHQLWPSDNPTVFFGHDPSEGGSGRGNAIHLDGGCVFGGELRAWDSRTGKIHAVKAARAYAEGDVSPKTDLPPEVARRESYVKAGLLRMDVSDDGRLGVYTYTDQCVFAGAWDEITLNSRGHVFDRHTGECIARPFPKFFNVGEREDTQERRLPWTEPHDVYAKEDGWLGILYRQDGYKVASRGSFHSDGAVWATSLLQDKDLSFLPDEATLCFEMIASDLKIILDYEEDHLCILAAFNRHTGEEYPRKTVEEWAKRAGLRVVERYEGMTLRDCLDSAPDLEGSEGFVIRFEGGLRVKVKTEWYKNLSRIMSNLSPLAIWNVMENGSVPEEYLAQIPEELLPLAEQYRDAMEDLYSKVAGRLEQRCRPMVDAAGGDMKKLAMSLEGVDRSVRAASFASARGRHGVVDNIVSQLIRPSRNTIPSEDEISF